MKLNHDCVRDLMLLAEEALDMSNFIRCSNLKLEPYSNQELIYTASKLIEAGLVEGKYSRYIDGDSDATIRSITWAGHEFLDNIRDDGVWKTTKDKLSDFKSASLSFVNNVASQVLASMINQKLGL